MQPKDLIYSLENLPIPNYLDQSIVLEVNNKSIYDIPGLFKLGVPDISQNNFSTASVAATLLYQFKLATNIYMYVESKYLLIPNYFTSSRGVIIAHCNGSIIPVVVVAKNKRTKEYGLYINTDFLESSTNLKALNTAFNKFKLDWILAGYGLLTKKQIEKCFISADIPTFSTIKEMKSWEEYIKEEIYKEVVS